MNRYLCQLIQPKFGLNLKTLENEQTSANMKETLVYQNSLQKDR